MRLEVEKGKTSLNVEMTLMDTFYSSFIEPFLIFAMICWFRNTASSLKLCCKISGATLFQHLYEARFISKAQTIFSEPEHPLHVKIQGGGLVPQRLQL